MRGGNKKMKKLALIIFLASTAFLTACRGSETNEIQPQNQAYETEIGSITMALLSSLDSFPVFLGYEKGFFEAEGLNMNIYRFSSAADRDVAFQINEEFDGLVFDAVALSLYQNAGIDMVASSATMGLASIIGGEGIYTMHDLVGNNVLISVNTSMDYILHTAFDKYGINPSDVIIEAVPSLPTRLEMLRAGQGQAATLPEPLATIAQKDGLNFITNTRELDINPFIFAFRRSTIEQKSNELAAFYRALENAINFINTADREEFIDILIEIAGYPQEMRDMIEIPQFNTPRPAEHAHIQEVIDFAINRGLIDIELTAGDVIVDIFNQ